MQLSPSQHVEAPTPTGIVRGDGVIRKPWGLNEVREWNTHHGNSVFGRRDTREVTLSPAMQVHRE